MAFIVPEGHWAIRENCGQFQGVLEPGIHGYVPGLYTTKTLASWGTIANKQGYLIEKSEQQTNTPTRHCQTKDNVTLSANTSIGWRIIDPKKAAYAIDNLPPAISDIALNTLRANIGTLNFDEIFSSKHVLNEKIKGELSETVAQWGVELLRVEIQELNYSKTVESAMIKEMAAKREKQALLSIAEGESKSTLMKAKAKAEALIISSQAQASALELKAIAAKNYLRVLKSEVTTELAASILKEEKTLESLEKITENPSHKVFFPPIAATQVKI